MSIENTQENQSNEQWNPLIYTALMNLEYIFSEYRNFGAHEEEFKARAYATYQIIIKLMTSEQKVEFTRAMKDVKKFDKMRSKMAA